ncbi:MAG TPA: homocysteine S-methyltransferase family protein [Polyangiaceae bacterium]|nr:homocysteine S-methyltransferase family protein [Polyangiaceae bacterium]
MSFAHVKQRLLAGRPLVVAADSNASLRARGVALDVPGALGQLLREHPEEVREHYRVEVSCRADVLAALTGDTTPRALAEVGMEHRAAQLTGRAVELALDAAEESAKPVAVAGILGSDMVSPVAATRLHEELSEHAARLTAAGCELLIARGQGSRLNLMAAVVAGARTELPTWAVVERTGDTSTGSDRELFQSLHGAGASVVLFEVSSVKLGLDELARTREALEDAGLVAGILLASSETALPGFPDLDGSPEQWADHALDLDVGGARVIGGGAGTTESHLRALAQALGSLHPSMPAHRSDTVVDEVKPPPHDP